MLRPTYALRASLTGSSSGALELSGNATEALRASLAPFVQGPIGPPGVTEFTRTAAQALGGHRAVIAVGDSGADYANASDVAHFGRVIGVTTEAASTGFSVNIKFNDVIDEPSWAWTIGDDVWVGDNGLLTQTLPSGAFIQRIGFALSPTRLWVDISEPFLL